MNLIFGTWNVSSPFEIRPKTVVSSVNLKIALEVWEAVQVNVYRDNRRELRTQPWGEPVLSKIVEEKRRQSLTCCGWLMRKSFIPWQVSRYLLKVLIEFYVFMILMFLCLLYNYWYEVN